VNCSHKFTRSLKRSTDFFIIVLYTIKNKYLYTYLYYFFFHKYYITRYKFMKAHKAFLYLTLKKKNNNTFAILTIMLLLREH